MSRLLLSLRIPCQPLHTRTRVWTPWSVFQDGSVGHSTVLALGDERSSRTQPAASDTIRSSHTLWKTEREMIDFAPSRNVHPAVHRNPFTKGGRVTALYTQQGRVPALLVRSARSRRQWTHMPQLAAHTPQDDECTSHAASRVQTLTLQRFQARLTLFPKCFPPFPQGTCSLSYSGRYLATDGTYHRISAPVPRNATLWTFNRMRSAKLR